jgi:sugar phosphate isomerase/epimerase
MLPPGIAQKLSGPPEGTVLLGYNTNGFTHHRIDDALRILADLGYRSVALTLDYQYLNPFDPDTASQAPRVAELLRKLGLRCVIETGARFLLDPWHKHQPTLLAEQPQDRGRRLDFLRRSVDLARDLGADAVSFWSGRPCGPAASDVLMQRLVTGCRELADYAAERGMRLAFEPEPGMFLDTMAGFAELFERVSHPAFGLTLDVGHLYCTNEEPAGPHLRRWRQRLWNVHLEDMRRGVHDHLMFGEGEVDFAETLKSLKEINYSGGVHVELSRHSHDAVETARRSLAFLRGALTAA